MTPKELKEYFEYYPLPQKIDWKPWAKIRDSKKFVENAIQCIDAYRGPYEDCPEYWFLMELHREWEEGRLK